MLQHSMAQKSELVVDKQVLENKVKKRNELISLLEKEVSEMKDQVILYLIYNIQIKARDEKLSFINIQRGTLLKTLSTNNNVVKIIKGGHSTHKYIYSSLFIIVKQNAQIYDDTNINTEKEE